MSTPTSPFSHLDPARKKLALDRAAEKLREIRESAPETLRRLQEEIKRRTQLSSLQDIPPKLQSLLSPARYKGAHGGRGSAKSWSFAKMALLRCKQRPGSRIVCVREVQKSLEQSVKRLLEDLIKQYGLADFEVLNTSIKTPGDGLILFQGMQDHTADSIKSLEGYDVAWVEEAQSLSARSLMLLRPTLRKEDSEIWFTWNPRFAKDPVDQFLRVQPPPNSIVVEVTYHDNPYLPEVLQDELEWDQRRDPDKYEHIWLGGYEKHSEARVFKNWRVEEFEVPKDQVLYLGGDWGFSIDPTVLIACYPIGKTLYFPYEVYKIGCEIDDTPTLFDSLGCKQQHPHSTPCDALARKWPIIADSARPETISYLQRHGYPLITPAKKGPDSVKEGVIFLQSYDIVIHPRCVHTIDEFTMYSYKVDKATGIVTPILSDKKNHVIDSSRYAVERLRAPVQEEEFLTW